MVRRRVKNQVSDGFFTFTPFILDMDGIGLGMICQHAPPILAVDGGGTHCRLACNHQGDIVQIEAGAANVSNDFDAAVAEIIGGLDTLCAMVGDSAMRFCTAPPLLG